MISTSYAVAWHVHHTKYQRNEGEKTMRVILSNNLVIIMYKNTVLVQAKGTKKDVARLMIIAQENLQELAA